MKSKPSRPIGPDQPWKQLAAEIDACMLRDRFALHRDLRRLAQRRGAQREEGTTRLRERIGRSRERVARRGESAPRTTYPEGLPISEHREEIAAAIAANQVTVVCGETGSGKTTQLPKICLQLGRGIAGMIGHTQPRRIAARNVSARIAEELKIGPGQQVGYKVRFNDRVGADTLVKLMTDGILLAEVQGDRKLLAYDTIIIDEAHERSLNVDFLLGYLKRLLPSRPELKLIVISATIDPRRFSSYFDDAPVVRGSGSKLPGGCALQAATGRGRRRAGSRLAAGYPGCGG